MTFAIVRSDGCGAHGPADCIPLVAAVHTALPPIAASSAVASRPVLASRNMAHQRVLWLCIAFRLLNALCTGASVFNPDEYWQSMEVAYALVWRSARHQNQLDRYMPQPLTTAVQFSHMCSLSCLSLSRSLTPLLQWRLHSVGISIARTDSRHPSSGPLCCTLLAAASDWM